MLISFFFFCEPYVTNPYRTLTQMKTLKIFKIMVNIKCIPK